MFQLRMMLLALALALVAGTPARAVSLLRDADIEYALAQLAAPILRACGPVPGAGPGHGGRRSSLNAFIADTEHIFIHSGMILTLDKRGTGAGGHRARGGPYRERPYQHGGWATCATARTAAGLGLILSAAAGAATGSGEAAAAIALGTQGSAMRQSSSSTRAPRKAPPTSRPCAT